MIPAAEPSKAMVYGFSLAGIEGLNTAGGMDICLLWVMNIVKYRSLWQADLSSTEVLLPVVRHCVWSRNLKNEVVLILIGLLR